MGWESSCPYFSSLVSASAWLHVSYYTPFTQHMFAASLWVLLGQLWLLKTQLASCSLGTTWPLTVATPQSTGLLLQKWPLKSIMHQDLLVGTALEGAGLGFAEPTLESCKPQTQNSVGALVSGPNSLLWSLFYWMSKWVLTKLEWKLCRFSSCFLCDLT